MKQSNPKLEEKMSELVNQELAAFYEYQFAVQSGVEGSTEINWVFISKKQRQDVITELVKALPSFKADKSHWSGRDTAKIESLIGITERLLHLEQSHSRRLQKIRDDFYCPQEIKKIIDETLLPVSLSNIKVIKDQRKPEGSL